MRSKLAMTIREKLLGRTGSARWQDCSCARGDACQAGQGCDTCCPQDESRAGQAGETLVEALVAMTVAGLCLIMLAMAMAVSVNIVTRSTDTADRYYQANNALASQTGTEAGSVQVTTEAGTISATATTTGPISVDCDVNEDLPGGGDAVAYRAKEYKEG